MIRPLRSRHRRMILGLAIVVGLLALFGIMARRPVPAVDRLPAEAVQREVGP